jgi:hypothetical protein
MIGAAMLTAMLVVGSSCVDQQQSPDTSSILRGILTDATTSAPVADAQVSIGIGHTMKTGPDGRFEFRGLSSGTYTLTVSRIGYIFVRRRIEVTFNTIVETTVPLAEGTGTYQETVTVTSDTRPPPELGVSMQHALGSATLQDLRGVVADDPMRAMQALPGVATGDDFQAQFSLRGSAFSHVGIVTDGVTTPLLIHQVRGAGDTGSIAMINTDVVQRASLLAGPHPRRDGDWIGATMSFDLREGSRDRATLRAAVSGTSASTVLEGPIGLSKRGSWLVSLRKSYVDWLIRKIEPSIDSTFGFADMQAKAAYDLTGRQQLQFLAVGGTAQYQEVVASTANGLKDATSHSALSSIAWRYTRPSLIVTQRVSLLNMDFDDRGERGQQLSRGTAQSIVWRGDVVRPLDARWTLEGGALTESQHASQMLREYRLVSNVLRVDSEQTVGGPNTIASGWGQISRRTASLGIVAGVRGSNASMGSWTTWSPWLLAEQKLGDFTVRAGLGAASQVPDIVIFKANGRSSMAPEHAVSVDVGVEHHLSKTLRWQVTGFRRDDSNIIRRIGETHVSSTGTLVAETPQPVFGAELDGVSRGVDVVLERRAPAGLSGWVGYSWAHTPYHDTVTGENFDGDFDQRHTLNVFAQQRLSYRLAVSAKLRMGSNFPIVGYFSGTNLAALQVSSERNQVRLPRYTRLDLRANYLFTFDKHRLTLFVEMMNATGRENLGQADGFVTSQPGGIFLAQRYAERLIPRVPSAGFLIEF